MTSSAPQERDKAAEGQQQQEEEGEGPEKVSPEREAMLVSIDMGKEGLLSPNKTAPPPVETQSQVCVHGGGRVRGLISTSYGVDYKNASIVWADL